MVLSPPRFDEGFGVADVEEFFFAAAPFTEADVFFMPVDFSLEVFPLLAAELLADTDLVAGDLLPFALDAFFFTVPDLVADEADLVAEVLELLAELEAAFFVLFVLPAEDLEEPDLSLLAFEPPPFAPPEDCLAELVVPPTVLETAEAVPTAAPLAAPSAAP